MAADDGWDYDGLPAVTIGDAVLEGEAEVEW